MKNIKWGCIQPLTGGMYLGAESAIGHPAEWILSYKHLDNVKTDKDGNIISCNNEYHLIEYLKKHNRLPKYYKFKDQEIFDTNITNDNPIITLNDVECQPDYSDLDLVVAVPVCSGLSNATRASEDTIIKRNCNMMWLAYYTLHVIKPKIYIFENAPTFMGNRGVELRKHFEELALKEKYSIIYYKTDSILHDNCQKRPRTFIIFVQHNAEDVMQIPPLYDYYANTKTILDVMNEIPSNSTQNDGCITESFNLMLQSYVINKYGDNWRNEFNGSIIQKIIKDYNLNDLIDYISNDTKFDEKIRTRSLKYYNHIKYKHSIGGGWYGSDLHYFKEWLPAVQFKSIPCMMHLTEDRLYSPREYMTLMGMPFDFELQGKLTNQTLAQIGQNVPVKTAKFIVEQALNIINKWNDVRSTSHNCIYQNNINRTEQYI